MWYNDFVDGGTVSRWMRAKMEAGFMGKKQREAKVVAQVVEARVERAALQPRVGIELSSDGESFVLTLSGHSVRISCPNGGDAFCTEARKGLVVMRDQIAAGTKLPTSNDVEHILDLVRVAERSLIGLALMHATLKARVEEPLSKINSKADPTQALVDTFLRAGGRVERDDDRAEAQLVEKYGEDILALIEGVIL